jgi:two-component system NtrC family response regulator
MGGNPVSFTPEAEQTLREYPWPGNVRELENCIERLSIIAPGGRVTPEILAGCSVSRASPENSPENAAFFPAPDRAVFPLDLDRHMEELERGFIIRALEETGGVQIKAAELLHISERSIWHRIKKFGIAVLNKREFL